MLIYLVTDTGAVYLDEIKRTREIKKIIKTACVKIIRIVSEKGTVLYENQGQ